MENRIRTRHILLKAFLLINWALLIFSCQSDQNPPPKEHAKKSSAAPVENKVRVIGNEPIRSEFFNVQARIKKVSRE